MALLASPSQRALRVLVVEDDPAYAAWLQITLSDAVPGFAVQRAGTIAEALAVLGAGSFDLVLLDLGLPDAQGLQGLDALRILARGASIVVLSGRVDAELEHFARSHGAADVLSKSARADALVGALRTVAGQASFAEALGRALADARAGAVATVAARVAVEGWDVAAATLDADDHKHLEEVVLDRVRGAVAPSDAVVALTGGELGVVCAGSDSPRALVAAVTDLFEEPFLVGGEAISLDARVAAITLPTDAATVERAVTHLRDDLRGARDGGPGMRAAATAAASAREAIDAPAGGLRRALERDEFVLHYQPLLRLGDEEVLAVEALIRWDHPQHGLLPPADFITLAEETGVIEEIGAWALAEACRQQRAWEDDGLPPLRVAVNLSARELCSPELPGRVRRALAASRLGPERLEIELTESMFADPEGTARVLQELREIGVRVSIDDFGTGYSSLAYLARIAVDAVKIDGSLVRDAAAESSSREVLRAIVGIAGNLGLEVVAEGVETREQLDFVEAEGCDYVQGWLFCAAFPPDELAEWLRWAHARLAAGPASRRDSARPAARVPARRASRLHPRRIVASLFGLALGLAIAVPAQMPLADRCGSRAEGGVMCRLQNDWIPTVTVAFAIMLACMLVVDFVPRLPSAVRRRRDPEARMRRRGRGPSPAAHDDPLLLAASWNAR